MSHSTEATYIIISMENLVITVISDEYYQWMNTIPDTWHQSYSEGTHYSSAVAPRKMNRNNNHANWKKTDHKKILWQHCNTHPRSFVLPNIPGIHEGKCLQ